MRVSIHSRCPLLIEVCCKSCLRIGAFSRIFVRAKIHHREGKEVIPARCLANAVQVNP